MLKNFYHFNFQNCVKWSFVGSHAIIIKTITGLFPLTWQDGIGGDLVDYSITGASGGVGDYGGKRNQLVVNGNFADTSGWSWQSGEVTVENNVFSIVVSGVGHTQLYRNANVIESHKYLVLFDTKSTAPIVGLRFYLFTSPSVLVTKDIGANVWTNIAEIIEAGSSGETEINIYIQNGDIAVGEKVQYRNFMLIDLTAMFPTDTPTDVSTAKARIAEVMGQQEYYPYDAGTDYYCIPVKVVDNADYEQEHTIYRTTQLTANQTIRKTTDGLPNFTNLPTGYLQMGVDTQVQPSAGSVTYKAARG